MRKVCHEEKRNIECQLAKINHLSDNFYNIGNYKVAETLDEIVLKIKTSLNNIDKAVENDLEKQRNDALATTGSILNALASRHKDDK